MFENLRRGRQAINFTTNVPKILDLKSCSEQIFSENWRWVPLFRSFSKSKASPRQIYNASMVPAFTPCRPHFRPHPLKKSLDFGIQSFERLVTKLRWFQLNGTPKRKNFKIARWQVNLSIVYFCQRACKARGIAMKASIFKNPIAEKKQEYYAKFFAAFWVHSFSCSLLR